MAENALRRSKRENAGVPPLRFGDEPGPSKKKPQPSEHSWKSAVSVEVEIADIDAKTAQQIAELEDQFDESENEFRMLQLELEVEKKKLETLEKQLEEAEGNEEQQKSLKESKQSLEANISSLAVDVERSKIKMEFQKRKLERERIVLLKVSDRNKKKVMGRELNGTSIPSCPSRVKTWAQRAAENRASSPHNPDDDIDQLHDDKSSKSGSTISIPLSLKSNTRECREMEKFAAAIAKGIASGNRGTKTLLARQAQGRDLPMFSGKPEEWPSFLCAFETSTKQCHYTNSDNLYRLQRALKGEALTTVQCLLLNPEGVPKVIEKLKMRFGRPEMIVDSLIQKVKAISKIRYENLETFVEFGIAVENLSSIIVALKVNEHLNNPMLIKELVQKLPPVSQLEWTKHCQSLSRSPNVKDFASWVGEYTKAACMLCPVRHKPEESRKRRYEDKVFTMSEQKKSRSENLCQLCRKSGHRIAKCSEFDAKSVNARWDYVKAKKLCFGCLIFGHSMRNCRNKQRCGEDGCGESHHKLLHTGISNNVLDNEASHHVVNSEVYFSVVPAILEGPEGKLKRLVMFDTGSTFTSIDEDVCRKLGLPGQRKPLHVRGYQTSKNFPSSRSVELKISSTDGTFSTNLSGVRTISSLDLPHQCVKMNEVHKWSHLKNIKFESFSGKPVMLIGLDNTALLKPIETVSGNGNAPIGVKTVLGWTLLGRGDFQRECQYGYHVSEVDTELHTLVKESFSLDAVGVTPRAKNARCQEDAMAQKILDNTIKRTSDGWECGLLWKNEPPAISESYWAALNRLKLMERKMSRNPEFREQYRKKINEYIDKGYAVKVENNLCNDNSQSFFLPHFMAVNPKKPNKLRFVFDSACKIKGKSFNDFLLKGPDKMISLPGVLLKFRAGKYAITADIRDMFHRVKVAAADSKFQRFLFRTEQHNEPEVYQMNVLIFGASCSPVCAREVKDRNAAEFKDKYPHAYDAIVNKHYVDDYLDSSNDLICAKNLINEVRYIQSRGNFQLVNWLSNSKELLAEVPDDIRASGANNLLAGKDCEAERVLGLFWLPTEDVFSFRSSFLKVTDDLINLQRLPTKRELLALAMSIYDPLGFIGHFTVKARILLQMTWRENLEWDEEIPRALAEPWKKWISHLQNLSTFRLPRWYSSLSEKADSVELHTFVDASEEAYGAVSYLRFVCENEIDVSFVMSKARVTPLKNTSIPRLELQAALIGARLAKFVVNELNMKINKLYFWSDSKTALSWIKSASRKFQQFVAHRVGEIQELTDSRDWRWVSTKNNVADEMTRLAGTVDWSHESRWMNGPKFLREIFTFTEEEANLEKSGLDSLVVSECVNVIDDSKFSFLSRLLHVTAYVLRFRKILQRGQFSKVLTPSEVEEARLWWVRRVQLRNYAGEFNLLKKGDLIPKISKLYKLCVYVDEDEVIRVKGRLDNSGLPFAARRPIVLPSQDWFSFLVMMQYHVKLGHQGYENIINEIRQNYYIPGLRSAVRILPRKCQECKVAQAKPQLPMMGQLPSYRLESHVRPFTNCGLDYFGPIEVACRRSRVKRYGVLFTCLSVRAIHLEIAHSLTTDSCLQVIRRFIARRGAPKVIFSDNGTNLVGAAAELKQSLKEFNQTQLAEGCLSNGIEWKFIPPSAPHFGGSWERMVRSVKVALDKILKSRVVNDEMLLTLFCEAEHSVNSHPLTHVPDHPADDEALTPNHFLIGSSSISPRPGVFDETDLIRRKHWRAAQFLADQFWQRWTKEYLPTLLRREKWCEVGRPAKEGDVVIEVSPNLPRNTWKKGRIVKMFPGKDGHVRVVDVRLANGHVYRRPLARL